MEDLLPKVRIDLSEPPERVLGALPGDPVLEIGFGGGEHLAAGARAAPDRGFLGCEPYENGVAKLLAAIDEEGLDNVRIHPGDARDLIDWLPNASLSRIDLLYPDPWPKTRHHKRRFVSPDNLDAMARVLKPGCEFRFASDIDSYVAWTLFEVRRHPAFDWTANGPEDWRTPWPGWPGTRYEAKAVREGRQGRYLTFRRAGRCR